jgi:hypothetical protein
MLKTTPILAEKLRELGPDYPMARVVIQDFEDLYTRPN